MRRVDDVTAEAAARRIETFETPATDVDETGPAVVGHADGAGDFGVTADGAPTRHAPLHRERFD